tara:strand:+ start:648 stop:1553 length:906 start_codon:yes stop_codon:yes gene_type:complete
MNEEQLKDIYTEDLENFPDFKVFIENLKELENYNFDNHSTREIYDKYFDLATIFPTVFQMLNIKAFNEQRFFRARLGIDRKKEDVSIKQTYSYPPPSVCNENGRGNIKNKSVFYSSNNPNCAMLEVKPKKGDDGYISVWKGNAKKPVKVGILLPYDLPLQNEWNEMARGSFEYLESSLRNEAKEKLKHFMALYKFIPDRFIREKKPYHLTSMISNELLYGDNWRDFIIYPSVAAKTHMCNMAFHPNFVNENLVFEKVIRFFITDIVGERAKFNLGKVGYLENNKMIWRESNEEEFKFFEKE